MIGVLDRAAYIAAATAGIASLARLFGEERQLDATPVPGEEMPDVFRNLLVHHEHMTLRLAAHHGAPVHLTVREVRADADEYARRILLTSASTGGQKIVEFGIVRVRLDQTSPAVRAEILKEQTPLGDILIKHNVLRRVEPRWFYRFGPDSSVRSELYVDAMTPVFGRVGTIYCDERPAIELLEVVTT